MWAQFQSPASSEGVLSFPQWHSLCIPFGLSVLPSVSKVVDSPHSLLLHLSMPHNFDCRSLSHFSTFTAFCHFFSFSFQRKFGLYFFLSIGLWLALEFLGLLFFLLFFRFPFSYFNCLFFLLSYFASILNVPHLFKLFPVLIWLPPTRSIPTCQLFVAFGFYCYSCINSLYFKFNYFFLLFHPQVFH